MKKNKPYDKSVYRSVTMIMQLGINMIVPIAMTCAVGIFLDRKFHSGWITIILFFVGAIAGAQNVYRMLKSIYDTPDNDLYSGKQNENHTKSVGTSEKEK